MPTCTKLIKKFYNCHFTLLTLLFRAPHLHRKFQPQNFLELCLGMAVSETSSNCIQLHFHHTSLQTFLFKPLAVHIRYFCRISVMDRDLFVIFPAEAPVLCREVQLKSLKNVKDFPRCGSLESIFCPHTLLHYTCGTSVKLFY